MVAKELYSLDSKAFLNTIIFFWCSVYHNLTVLHNNFFFNLSLFSSLY